MPRISPELRHKLDEALERFNCPAFLETDPIAIPHRFTSPRDIEIAAFFTAILAWGTRTGIRNSASKLMALMDNSPHAFLTGMQERDLKRFDTFVHRTFLPADCQFFIWRLHLWYSCGQSLESRFADAFQNNERTDQALHAFREDFLQVEHLARSHKHLSDPLRGSAAKRLNMFLRWMVRKDNRGVDFGLWSSISPSRLIVPLDVHTARMGRHLGLLVRKQNDWKAAEELTAQFRKLDPCDPVKYDFALFGLATENSKATGKI